MRYPIELIQVRAILRRYLAENPRPDCHREGVSLALDAL